MDQTDDTAPSLPALEGSGKTQCKYCGRHSSSPCRNTRDMDPEDGFNPDTTCHVELARLGGGERVVAAIDKLIIETTPAKKEKS